MLAQKKSSLIKHMQDETQCHAGLVPRRSQNADASLDAPFENCVKPLRYRSLLDLRATHRLEAYAPLR